MKMGETPVTMRAKWMILDPSKTKQPCIQQKQHRIGLQLTVTRLLNACEPLVFGT